jgi:hypothetical protein
VACRHEAGNSAAFVARCHWREYATSSAPTRLVNNYACVQIRTSAHCGVHSNHERLGFFVLICGPHHLRDGQSSWMYSTSFENDSRTEKTYEHCFAMPHRSRAAAKNSRARPHRIGRYDRVMVMVHVREEESFGGDRIARGECVFALSCAE